MERFNKTVIIILWSSLAGNHFHQEDILFIKRSWWKLIIDLTHFVFNTPFILICYGQSLLTPRLSVWTHLLQLYLCDSLLVPSPVIQWCWTVFPVLILSSWVTAHWPASTQPPPPQLSLRCHFVEALQGQWLSLTDRSNQQLINMVLSGHLSTI